MNNFLQDIRFGLRMLRKNPGFTLVAVLTLALGIGANTSIFSVINTLMLRSLPVHNPNELVLLSMDKNPIFTYPIYEKLRDGNRTLSGLSVSSAGTSKQRMIASGVGGTETEFIQSQKVSGNFFSVLGVSAIVGRTLSPEDDRSENPQPVTVLSYNFWQRRFGKDPTVLGKTITLDDVSFTIIGITPPEFFGIEIGRNPDLWYPIQMVTQFKPNTSSEPLMNMLSRHVWWLRVMGRIPNGIDARQAQSELDVLFQQYLDWEYTRSLAEGDSQRQDRSQETLVFQPGNNGWTDLRGQFRQPLLILLAAAGLVMLIACANVASLLLARASARMREYSIRHALGAGRMQLIRQMITESMLLSILGGLLGVFFAQWGTDLLLYITNIQNDSVSFNVTPDVRVLIFTTAITLLTGLLSGLPYALRSSRLDTHAIMKGSSAGAGMSSSRQRLNRTLVIVQLALSMVLLIGAGLFVRTLENLKELDAGFNRQNITLFDFDFTKSLDKPSRTSFYKSLLERLELLPGIQTVSLSVIQPLGSAGWTQQVNTTGNTSFENNSNQICYGMSVGPHFFKAMGIPLLNGREFDSREELLPDSATHRSVRSVIINESMARRYFFNENPVGRQIYLDSKPEQAYEVIGVVKDAKYYNLRESSRPIFYMPFFQEPDDWGMKFIIRSTSDSRPIISNLRNIVSDINSSVQVHNLRTMEDVVNASLHQEWTIAQLGGFFSAVALVLACLGLYGVLSFAVTQRTREIGIRIALGARQHNVLSLIVSQGLTLVVIGLSLGLLAALAMTRILSSFLYGVTPTDPMTIAGVSLLLLCVTLLACYLPARRATRVDPMTALRCD